MMDILVSWTEHRTNQSIAFGVTSGTLLNLIKKKQLSYFGHIKRHQPLEKLILEGKGKLQRNRGKRSWEKDVKDWIRAGVVSGEWDEQQMIG